MTFGTPSDSKILFTASTKEDFFGAEAQSLAAASANRALAIPASYGNPRDVIDVRATVDEHIPEKYVGPVALNWNESSLKKLGPFEYDISEIMVQVQVMQVFGAIRPACTPTTYGMVPLSQWATEDELQAIRSHWRNWRALAHHMGVGMSAYDTYEDDKQWKHDVHMRKVVRIANLYEEMEIPEAERFVYICPYHTSSIDSIYKLVDHSEVKEAVGLLVSMGCRVVVWGATWSDIGRFWAYSRPKKGEVDMQALFWKHTAEWMGEPKAYNDYIRWNEAMGDYLGWLCDEFA